MLNKTFIFGLGNPGNEHQLSRHNAGFLFADYLRQKLSLPNFSLSKKMSAEVSSAKNIVLAKPQTYMNLSGQAVRQVLKYSTEAEIKSLTNTDLENIYVAHDDLDIPIGEFKLQKGVGPKQHNGLLSVYQSLKATNFWHIRLGVDDRQGDRSVPPDKYVLQKLPPEQLSKLKLSFAGIVPLLQINK